MPETPDETGSSAGKTGSTSGKADAPSSKPDATAKDEARSGADRIKEGVDRARGAFNERVVEPAKRAGEAVRASNQKWAEGNSEIGLKMIDQAEDNVHQAFAAMRQAARAKDLSEVLKIQADFLREQSSRSVEQAREIGEMIVKVGRDSVEPLRPGQSSSGPAGSGSTKT